MLRFSPTNTRRTSLAIDAALTLAAAVSALAVATSDWRTVYPHCRRKLQRCVRTLRTSLAPVPSDALTAACAARVAAS